MGECSYDVLWKCEVLHSPCLFLLSCGREIYRQAQVTSIRLKSGTLEKQNETTAMFPRQDLPVLPSKAPRPAGKEGKEEMLHFCVTANGVQ